MAASSAFDVVLGLFGKQSKNSNVIPVHSSTNNTRMTKLFLSLLLTASFAIAAKADNPGNESKVNVTASTLEWTGRKVTGKHNGTVNLKEGSLQIKDGFLLGGSFVIDMTTIKDTDMQGEYATKLEGHLKSDDFFGVANFSESKLVIKSVTGMAMAGEFVVNADLTIKGITKPVSFKTKAAANSATATVKIDRTKYDIKYGSGSFFENLGDKAIDNEFELTISLVY